MPLYDYKCPKCEAEVWDRVLDIDHGKQKCPSCKTIMVQKLSPPHIRFEGRGWTPNAGIVRRK